jgi:hypothetical protein
MSGQPFHFAISGSVYINYNGLSRPAYFKLALTPLDTVSFHKLRHAMQWRLSKDVATCTYILIRGRPKDWGGRWTMVAFMKHCILTLYKIYRLYFHAANV